MTYATSQLMVDDLWRNLLVVTSDMPVDWTSQTEIIHEIQTDDGIVRVYHYTEGLYKEFERDGEYYYWFLFNYSRITLDGESDELRELKQAYQILTEGEADELR